MSCLNYWWLWKKQLNRPAAPPGVRLTLENTTGSGVSESTLTLGCLWKPTVIIVPLSLGVKPAEHSQRTQETEAAEGRAQPPPESKSAKRESRGRNKPWKVVSRCQYLHTRPPGDSNMTDSSHFTPFFLGWMCIPEDILKRSHIYDQQSYTDFPFFFSVGLSHFSIWFYCQCENFSWWWFYQDVWLSLNLFIRF